MKRLIIPDIHNDIKPVKTFLEKFGNDFEERYFLGDYFDDFGDNPYIAGETARFVKDLLADPRNKLMLGNHDTPYRYPYNNSVTCPGFEIQKSLEIGKILNDADWRKIKLAYYVDGWLISHAGVHPSFFGWPRISLDCITINDIMSMCDKALERVDNNGFDVLLMPGMDRGFHGQQYGGITWLDWNKLPPIPGINQIVGHTPGTYPFTRYTTKKEGYVKHVACFAWDEKTETRSQNWCVDSETRAYIGVLKDGNFKVYLRDDYVSQD